MFWTGFYKKASLIGAMPGITSGIRSVTSRMFSTTSGKTLGKIRTAKPVTGQTIGPRSSAPQIATHSPSQVKIPSAPDSATHKTRGMTSMTV